MHVDAVKFLMGNHLTSLILYPMLWAIVGAICGLVLGLLSFFALHAKGAFRLESKRATWLRALAGLLIGLVATIAGGITGFHEGVWRSVQRIAQDGKLSEQMMPQMGHSGARLIARIYLLSPSPRPQQIDEPKLRSRLEAFSAGAWELDVPELQHRMLNVPAYTVNAAIQAISHDTMIRCPELRNTPAEKLLLWFLGVLGGSILPEPVQNIAGDIEGNEALKALKNIWRQLPEEAAKHGDPRTISYRELSVFIGRIGVDAVLIKPVRAAMRAQQVGAMIFFLSTLLFLIAAFRIGETVRQRRVATTNARAEFAGERAEDQ